MTTGPVTLDGGTLKLASGLTDFSSGIIAGAANGTLNMGGQTINLGGTNNGEGGITFENGNLTLNTALEWQGKTVLGSGVLLTTTVENQLSEHSTLSFADATASLESNTKQTIGGLEGNGSIKIGDSLTVGVNNSDTVYGGQISSEGGLYKVGTGTLTLTNEQLYEGGTFVQDGVLTLTEKGKFWDESNFTLTGGVLDLGGKSQKASSLLLDGGAILNGKLETTGKLELKSGELGIDLTGDTDLEKNGDGTLVISGDNSGYSGVITVSTGEVQGAVAAFGTSNKIVNNGQVSFTDDGEAIWNGAITGTGSLALTGGGDYTITGNDNTYSGQTLIHNASLTLNGELSNSDVIIENGGRFGGNNTVGSLTANGIIAPGNSIGVITTIGDFTLGKDGIYEIEVAANGENDRIIVGGTAYLQGDRIHVTALDEKVSYQQVQTHTFLTAEGGIEGEFSEAVSKSIFLRTQLDHQHDHVKLNVAVLPDDGYFEDVATTSNQKAVARAVESLEQTGSALALYNSVLFLESEDAARTAFTQLSGENHASTKSALIDAINRVGDVVNDRIRSAFEGVASKDLPVLSYTRSRASKDTEAFDAVDGKSQLRLHRVGSWIWLMAQSR